MGLVNTLDSTNKSIHMHDIVRLNSGGPEMVVISVQVGLPCGDVTAIYEGSEGELKKSIFDSRTVAFVRRLDD